MIIPILFLTCLLQQKKLLQLFLVVVGHGQAETPGQPDHALVAGHGLPVQVAGAPALAVPDHLFEQKRVQTRAFHVGADDDGEFR